MLLLCWPASDGWTHHWLLIITAPSATSQPTLKLQEHFPRDKICGDAVCTPAIHILQVGRQRLHWQLQRRFARVLPVQCSAAASRASAKTVVPCPAGWLPGCLLPLICSPVWLESHRPAGDGRY